ncbi:hypothetical protein F7984_13335 [Pradoshia sp. D12]|jgi:hypothetical protein|uniref:YqhR family membrane protein n=1 Tax=Bacillaceae TaxID=186817 RepID=UPI00080AFB44|nr:MULTISPECIES: YqhR family membrane protein [Bacillaceae]OCA86351.1 hypothetical protein A8L44_08045 [Bacillus sp. FJAT-27986]QFK72151.1 hypothetical protein F7984_13335 [Pradoshia sp. D12]TPF71357.1 hypothetical protein FHY44_12865 [Bacillus sp. D12]
METAKEKLKKPMGYYGVINSVGFYGGLLWGAIFQICHYFHFTEIGPTFLLRTWVKADFVKGWMGVVLSILCLCLISMLFAYVYSFIFRKMQSYWIGIVYGIALWGLSFLVLRPLFPGMKTVGELSADTIVTTLCIFVLYGLFVGYSISFEYHERKLEAEEGKKVKVDSVQ